MYHITLFLDRLLFLLDLYIIEDKCVLLLPNKLVEYSFCLPACYTKMCATGNVSATIINICQLFLPYSLHSCAKRGLEH